MAGARVLVHDVDSLELFMETLQAKRDELEALYDILGSETANQGENWQDPQYEHLKGLIQAHCSSCNSLLLDLDESIDYIGCLIAKLRDI